MAQYDTIINGGRYFDGTGAPSSIQNIAIKEGRIALVTPNVIEEQDCQHIINAQGKWVTPGFLDTITTVS